MPQTYRQNHHVFYSVSNILTYSCCPSTQKILFSTMMVNFKHQHQYKQHNRRNKHQNYRHFTPFTKSFEKFKIGSQALPYSNPPRFEYRYQHITE
jgi:hypothetical protein